MTCTSAWPAVLVSVRGMVDIAMWVEPNVDDPGQALPFVDAVVGGRTIRVLLDSGAGRTTVTPSSDAIIELLPPEGTSVFGGQGERRVWRTTVELGPHRIGPIGVDTHGDGGGQESIGQDVLSQFRCEYRFADGLLRLDGPMPPVTTPIFLDRGNHIYLDLVWPEVTAGAVFDSGASVSVVDAAFVEAHPYLFVAQGDSQGTDASGTTFDTPMVAMRGPRILGRVFTSTPAAVVDLGVVNQTLERRMDLIIGWPLLHQANWAIDHLNQTAALTK